MSNNRIWHSSEVGKKIRLLYPFAGHEVGTIHTIVEIGYTSGFPRIRKHPRHTIEDYEVQTLLPHCFVLVDLSLYELVGLAAKGQEITTEEFNQALSNLT